LLLFLAWAAIEAFNPLSPGITYGFLGLKLYFYYIPLMFAAYDFLRTELDLRRFLVFNLALGCVISLLGVIQAITGQRFLNPEVLDQDLLALGNLNRYSPISGLVFNRPTSVFVSDGRFGAYLILMWILSFGTVGYFILARQRGGKPVYLCAAAVLAAILLSGVRTALVYSLIGTAVMVAGIVWGAQLRKEQVLRTLKAIRRFALLSSAGGICVALLYPEALASRWAFYMETLSPTGTASELTARGWEYPVSEFLKTFAIQNWEWGRGLGTASLGSQYLTRILNARPPGLAVENGYGSLLLEMGIPGLLLWIIMIIAIVRACWKVVKQLRATPMFPVAFSIFWFAFIVLFPLSFVGLSTYQDFIINANLWILIGILFRLPALLDSPMPGVEKPMLSWRRGIIP
jgi:O-antigen ligase